MYDTQSQLLDEILTETRNYRCEYLDIIIEKYVKTQDESVEIQLRNFTVAKSTNKLKRFEEKPFGYVSSYECKTAKKSINFWKKKVILQKRASFRKYVGVESSNANYGKNLKYLSHTKAYKTLSSIQKNKLYSSEEETESILSNETILNSDQTFAEENESTLSFEDGSLLSDTENIASKKIKRKVFIENETIKSLATTNKDYQLSENYIPKFSFFENKNCDVNLLKFEDPEQLILIKKKPPVFNRICDDKAPNIVYQKLSVCFKDIDPGRNRDNRNIVCSKGASFVDYVSSKFTPKLRFSDIGLEMSNKNRPVSHGFNSIALPHASNKFNESSKTHWKDKMLIFNNSCQTSNVCNDKSSSYDSNSSTKFIKLRNREVPMKISEKNGQIFNACSAKSLPVSNKLAELSKLNSSKIRIEKSENNCATSNDYSVKPISYDLNKSTEIPKLRSREDEMVISNKKCQPSDDHNAKSLSCSSNKVTETLKLRPKENEMEISNKDSQVSNSNKLNELSKLSSSKIRIEKSKKSCATSNDYAVKSISYNFKKSAEILKLRSSGDEMVTSNKKCQPSGDCNAKPLSCASNEVTETPKLRPRENEMKISNKDSQATGVCSTKSLIYAPNKSIETRKQIYSETDTKTLNRNCQTFLNSFPIKRTSLSSSLSSGIDISVEIDSLSLRKGESNKNKSSLAQSTLSFKKCKSFKNYPKDAEIDELSFKKDSTPLKRSMNKQK